MTLHGRPYNILLFNFAYSAKPHAPGTTSSTIYTEWNQQWKSTDQSDVHLAYKKKYNTHLLQHALFVTQPCLHSRPPDIRGVTHRPAQHRRKRRLARPLVRHNRHRGPTVIPGVPIVGCEPRMHGTRGKKHGHLCR